MSSITEKYTTEGKPGNENGRLGFTALTGWSFVRSPSATRQSSKEDSRLCVPASRQVCLYRAIALILKELTPAKMTGERRRYLRLLFIVCQGLYFLLRPQEVWGIIAI